MELDLNDVVVCQRHERTPTTDAIVAFGTVATLYSTIHPGLTQIDFVNDGEFAVEALAALGSTDDIEGKIWAFHRQGTDSADIAATVLALKLACIYVYRAQYEDERGNRDLAWTYSTDARLWCATAASISDHSGLVQITDSCIMDVTKGLEEELCELDSLRVRTKEVAASGGKARAAKLKQLEEETIRLYEEGKRQGEIAQQHTGTPKKAHGKWDGLPEAADEIKPKIVDLSKKNGANLTPTTGRPLAWLRDHVYGEKPRKSPKK